MDAQAIAKMIDHTLLKPEATTAQVTKLCTEAKEYGFASVCINGVYVPLAAQQLQGSDVKVCTVVGFPLGAMITAAKVEETRIAIQNGAQEVDMVIPIGALKDEAISRLADDIAAVVAECQVNKVISKVIIETVLLSEQEKVVACKVAQEAGADFVKTSTGFAGGGATVADVKLMRETIGAKMGVKASGGVRNYADAIAMIDAGATRIGASSGVAIVTGSQSSADY
jgi:deoxyribose-phosphate aldolase